jgi:hypothetical protein
MRGESIYENLYQYEKNTGSTSLHSICYKKLAMVAKADHIQR